LVLVSNHQSLLDIPTLVSLIPHIRIIAKKELFRIPLFGRAMRRAGFLEIDRSNRAHAFRTIDDAAQRIRAGTSILVFAEGTRSRDDQILPFKKGAFVLATSAGVGVVPVAVRGTNRRLPKGASVVKPGPVYVAFGEVLAARPSDDRAELLAEAETRVRTLYASLPDS
jgi:1-acyl-sn-glycerol-3-phosphate acyltransferase